MNTLPGRTMTATCPLCDEKMVVERYEGKHGSLPADYHFYTVHDHSLEKPTWVGVLFHHEARERWAPTARLIQELRKSQLRDKAAARRLYKDSNG